MQIQPSGESTSYEEISGEYCLFFEEMLFLKKEKWSSKSDWSMKQKHLNDRSMDAYFSVKKTLQTCLYVNWKPLYLVYNPPVFDFLTLKHFLHFPSIQSLKKKLRGSIFSSCSCVFSLLVLTIFSLCSAWINDEQVMYERGILLQQKLVYIYVHLTLSFIRWIYTYTWWYQNN